jgi:hypothetical protein
MQLSLRERLLLCLHRQADLLKQARRILLTCAIGAPKRGVEFRPQSPLDIGADGPIGRGHPLDLASAVCSESEIQRHLPRWIAREGQAHIFNRKFETVQWRVREAGLCHRRCSAHTAKDDQQGHRGSHQGRDPHSVFLSTWGEYPP